jgi:Na+/melibiose symporter-like transporter
VFGLVVAAAGYENGVAVTPAMQGTIWFGFTIVPAISCLLSAVAFWFYRLEPKKAEPPTPSM